MGGPGSGPYSFLAKETTSECRQLDVRRWQRQGLLEPGQSFVCNWQQEAEIVASVEVHAEPDHVILGHERDGNTDDLKYLRYSVWIDWTPCHYGGKRAWFLCPVPGCMRRAAILYWAGVFACRSCHQLVYRSQRETASKRALRRAQAIRMTLGGSDNLEEAFPKKPKGMHWRRYERLQIEADVAYNRSWLLSTEGKRFIK